MAARFSAGRLEGQEKHVGRLRGSREADRVARRVASAELVFEPAQRHALREDDGLRLLRGRHDLRDERRLIRREKPVAKRVGHRAARRAKARHLHPAPCRTRRDVDPLLDVALEADKAELAVEPALLDLAQDPAQIVLDALLALHRPAQ